MAKSMKTLLMLLRKTAVFRRFSEWRLLMKVKMTREVGTTIAYNIWALW